MASVKIERKNGKVILKSGNSTRILTGEKAKQFKSDKSYRGQVLKETSILSSPKDPQEKVFLVGELTSEGNVKQGTIEAFKEKEKITPSKGEQLETSDKHIEVISDFIKSRKLESSKVQSSRLGQETDWGLYRELSPEGKLKGDIIVEDNKERISEDEFKNIPVRGQTEAYLGEGFLAGKIESYGFTPEYVTEVLPDGRVIHRGFLPSKTGSARERAERDIYDFEFKSEQFHAKAKQTADVFAFTHKHVFETIRSAQNPNLSAGEKKVFETGVGFIEGVFAEGGSFVVELPSNLFDLANKVKLQGEGFIFNPKETKAESKRALSITPQALKQFAEEDLIDFSTPQEAGKSLFNILLIGEGIGETATHAQTFTGKGGRSANLVAIGRVTDDLVARGRAARGAFDVEYKVAGRGGALEIFNVGKGRLKVSEDVGGGLLVERNVGIKVGFLDEAAENVLKTREGSIGLVGNVKQVPGTGELVGRGVSEVRVSREVFGKRLPKLFDRVITREQVSLGLANEAGGIRGIRLTRDLKTGKDVGVGVFSTKPLGVVKDKVFFEVDLPVKFSEVVNPPLEKGIRVRVAEQTFERQIFQTTSVEGRGKNFINIVEEQLGVSKGRVSKVARKQIVESGDLGVEILTKTSEAAQVFNIPQSLIKETGEVLLKEETVVKGLKSVSSKTLITGNVFLGQTTKQTSQSLFIPMVEPETRTNKVYSLGKVSLATDQFLNVRGVLKSVSRSESVLRTGVLPVSESIFKTGVLSVQKVSQTPVQGLFREQLSIQKTQLIPTGVSIPIIKTPPTRVFPPFIMPGLGAEPSFKTVFPGFKFNFKSFERIPVSDLLSLTRAEATPGKTFGRPARTPKRGFYKREEEALLSGITQFFPSVEERKIRKKTPAQGLWGGNILEV